MIVFFLPDLRGGGAERVMLNLLIAYKNENPGSVVVLLLFKKQGPLLNEVPTSIDIQYLNTANATRSVLPFILFCAKKRPKIIFSSLGASLTSVLAKPFLLGRIKLVNRIGNTIGAEKQLFSNPLKRWLYVSANKVIASYSDHVVFQCKYMEEDYLQVTNVPPRQHSVIYNPVNIDKVTQLSLIPLDKKYTLISVGRLDTQKDYFTLLSACAILKAKDQNFTLGILGEGPLKNELQKNIVLNDLEDNVIILGYVPNPYPLIRQAEYLVSSSLFEGFSNVIIESLCLGTPVIATDCPGGNSEVISNGYNGWLCKVQNPENMAQVLEKGLRNGVAYNSNTIASNARAIFDTTLIFKKYDFLLKQYYL